MDSIEIVYLLGSRIVEPIWYGDLPKVDIERITPNGNPPETQSEADMLE